MNQTPIVCALVEANQLDEARRELGQMLEISPDYSMAFAEWFFPIAYKYGNTAERYIEGLRKAGLPEG